MGVRPQIHRHPVDEDRHVSAVVGVEAAQEVLLGLAATLMLADHHATSRMMSADRPCGRSSKSRSGIRTSDDAVTGAGAVTVTGGSVGAARSPSCAAVALARAPTASATPPRTRPAVGRTRVDSTERPAPAPGSVV
jgi:hypothetical protein